MEKRINFFNRLFKGMFALIVILSMGCASDRTPATFDPFHPEDLNQKVRSGRYIQSIEDFMVILDTSGTMNKPYLYEVFPSSEVPIKLEVEKEIAKRINQTIPSLDLNAGIRTYGFGACQSWRWSLLRLKLGPYSKPSFDEALETIECAGGGSPMEYAIDAAGEDLMSAKRNMAIIIISDGAIEEEPFYSVIELRQKYGKRLCVYTISLGGEDYARISMRRLSAVSSCGYSVSAEEISTREGMANFIQRVFLKKSYSSVDGSRIDK